MPKPIAITDGLDNIFTFDSELDQSFFDLDPRHVTYHLWPPAPAMRVFSGETMYHKRARTRRAIRRQRYDAVVVSVVRGDDAGSSGHGDGPDGGHIGKRTAGVRAHNVYDGTRVPALGEKYARESVARKNMIKITKRVLWRGPADYG